jgi:hypothetical protein
MPAAPNIADSKTLDSVSVRPPNCRDEPSQLGVEYVSPNVKWGKKPMRFVHDKLKPSNPTYSSILPPPVPPCIIPAVRTLQVLKNQKVYVNNFRPMVAGDYTETPGGTKRFLQGPYQNLLNNVYIATRF